MQVSSKHTSLFLSFALGLGCTPPASNTTQTPVITGSTGSTGSTGNTAALSCLDVLKCVDACNRVDDCISKCVSSGSSAAQTQLAALLQCDADAGCDGENTCLTSNCAAEVNGCTGAGATGSTGPAVQSDGFDTGVDEWTIAGDAQSTSAVPDFNGTGGNPGGLISADDDAAGGTWYFVAPPKYLGDQSEVLGKTLQYDLKTTQITSPFGNYDVVLKGGGFVVVYNTTPDPGSAWTHYSVPLSASGWKTVSSEHISEISDDQFAALTDTTAQEFAAVLASLTLLRIRGEFNTGSDTGSLDNVRWGAP